MLLDKNSYVHLAPLIKVVATILILSLVRTLFPVLQGWTTACCRSMPERDGRTKERMAQSKRARAGSLDIDD